MSNPQTNGVISHKKHSYLNIAVSLILIGILATSIVFATLPANTQYIESGPVPGAPDYTIYQDPVTLLYCAKDKYGAISWTSTNASSVIQNTLTNLASVSVSTYSAGTQTTYTGHIHFGLGRFNITNRIEQPQYSRIKITGEGTSFQYPTYGLGGGTQILSSDINGCFKNYADCYLEISDLEFVQVVDCGSGNYSMNLSGYVHYFDNVNVINYAQISGITYMACGGISFGGGWVNDKSMYTFVSVAGFNGSSQIYSAHGTWDTCTFGYGGGLGITTGYRQVFNNLHISGVVSGYPLRVRGNISIAIDNFCLGECHIPAGYYKISFENDSGSIAKLAINTMYNIGDYVDGSENYTNTNFCDDWSRLSIGKVFDEVLKKSYSTKTPSLYITPTTSGFDTVPTDLAYITDGNFSTSATVANKNSSGVVDVGFFVIDLGHICTVQLSAKVGSYSNTSSVNGYWYWSNDNTNWYYASGDRCFTRTGTTESIRFTVVEEVTARYVRLAINAGAANEAVYAIVYEITATDLQH